MVINSVGLLITGDCNAKCKMCCDVRGEVKGHTLTESELLLLLNNIKKCKDINEIGITGGEPMLYPKIVENIIKFNYEKEMTFTLKTNGFWGKDKIYARKFLTENRDKLRMISFSYDGFHKEYIDVVSIKNIIEICFELRIATEVTGCFIKNDTSISEIVEDLGEHMFLTRFHVQPTIKTGRATEIASNKFYNIIDVDNHSTGCPNVLDKTLLINSNLDVFPCCSQVVENTCFNFGNIKKNELVDIIDEIYGNKIIYTLFTKGFDFFLDIYRKEGVDYPKYANSPCEICEYMFKNEDLLNILVKYL